ncbi:MAG: adenylate/guanylate cyclase domain-containing protein [Betaproteobacteria bacterium]|nr:adenylate/guanylate cyclase domain-containing protein [Betaproteobacteria bacterium]
MKKYLVRYLLGCAILLLFLGHAAKVYQIALIDRLDAIIYDTKLRLTMPQGVDERVVILDIDEKSLTEIGRWPWSRDRLATLVDKLFNKYGIRVLGFDIDFAEADRSSGLNSLENLASRDLKDSSGFQSALKKLRPQLDYDARFAESLRGKPAILGYYFAHGSASSGALPPPVLPEGAFPGGNRIYHWESYGGNLAELQENAAGGGYINPVVDLDGVIRRVPMLLEYRGAYYESLALAMVRAYLKFPRIVPGYPDDPETSGESYGSVEWLDLPTASGATLSIPVDENVAVLIPFRGYEKSFPYYSIADVLADRIPPALLKGRIVLVGTTAPGLKDQRSTPVGEIYSGVEVHANLIAGMLEGRIKEKPRYAQAVDILLLLIAGGVMAFLLPLMSAFRASVVALLVLLSLVGINLAFWQYANFVLPLAAGLLLATSLYALNMSWGYFVESRSKRQFTELFGQYVPPELVDEMSRNPEGYSMEGRKAELTVLFSDIRGFTTISEGLEPDQLATLMNEYLGAMTEVIRHQRGTLDKYIGDAIMAFWGAPVGDDQHARHALLAALGMQRELLKLNLLLTQKGWPELKIGVGVNTGVMTVGDMGSPVRKAYTVMGDAVNLGARLEGITKQYGVGIIAGEATRGLLLEEFTFRELDRVRVKGKTEPIGIYQPLGVTSELGKEVLEELALWHRALHYYRTQDWDRAAAALLDLSRMAPCYLYELYAERIEVYCKQPPGENWDGVTTFETK